MKKFFDHLTFPRYFSSSSFITVKKNLPDENRTFRESLWKKMSIKNESLFFFEQKLWHLEDGKVLQNAVHHILRLQGRQLQYKAKLFNYVVKKFEEKNP